MLKLYTTTFNVELHGGHTQNDRRLHEANELVERELEALAARLQLELAVLLSSDGTQPATVFVDGDFLV